MVQRGTSEECGWGTGGTVCVCVWGGEGARGLAASSATPSKHLGARVERLVPCPTRSQAKGATPRVKMSGLD